MSKIIPDVALLTGITVDDRPEDKSEAISNAISEDKGGEEEGSRFC